MQLLSDLVFIAEEITADASNTGGDVKRRDVAITLPNLMQKSGD
jgi:hypothetical protein